MKSHSPETLGPRERRERVHRVAHVLWSGMAGGTECLSGEIANTMRVLGHDARVLFIGEPTPLSDRLTRYGVPWSSLGITTTRKAFLQASQLVSAVEEWNAEGLVLPTCDALAMMLRRAHFRGRLIGVDHGAIGNLRDLSWLRRRSRLLSRRIGVRSLDVQVAVSDHVLREVAAFPHAESVVRVYNGVDTKRFVPRSRHEDRDETSVRIGAACRLVAGKGLPELLSAVARLMDKKVSIRVRLAGEGPMEAELRDRIGELRLPVELVGHVEDMAAFWQAQDIAVALPNELTETFGMSVAEAMSCGLPVVATSNGGLVEVVQDGVTGALVGRGDVVGASAAILMYVNSAEKRRLDGMVGRRRVEEQFSLIRCAREYLSLLRPDDCGSAQ